MRRFILPLLLLMMSTIYVQAQNIEEPLIKSKRKKGTLYASWGYNREWYSKSSIHIHNDGPIINSPGTDANGAPIGMTPYGNYDFTVQDAQAVDKPDFGTIPKISEVTIPQFSVRLGYMFNDKHDFGIELNYEHAKYVVNDYQIVNVHGQINGVAYNHTGPLDPVNFLHFEHTDGANFMTLNLVKRYQFYNAKTQKLRLSGVVKAGPGFVYPRTDVTLFGQEINNKWHAAGFIVSAEAGLRAEFLKFIFCEWTAKAGYANYTHSLVYKDQGKANHKFTTIMTIFTLGFQVPI
ncbi:MAG TPA: hypothetical protein VK750_04690 [Cytophagaceae bacterium]|jgi:hypothetical protein|nr:hypothetical protein [Cytophagaceae bacterium]